MSAAARSRSRGDSLSNRAIDPVHTQAVDRLAGALAAQGKLDEAETLAGQAASLSQERFGPEHLRTGGALKRVASIEVLRGKDSDAEAHYRRALSIDERVLGTDNPAVAGDLVALAPILQRMGKRQDAKADLERAQTIVTGQFGNDSLMSVGAMLALANLAWRFRGGLSFPAGDFGLASEPERAAAIYVCAKCAVHI
jgi:tetratricopeptide (TPR) repeat protein